MWVLGISLIILSLIDLRHRKIPVFPMILAIILGFLYVIKIDYLSFFEIILGVAIGIGMIFLAIFLKEAVGLGDGFCILFLGIFLGGRNTLLCLSFGFFIASFVAIVMLSVQKIKGRPINKLQRFPFIPCLFLGYMIYIWFYVISV